MKQKKLFLIISILFSCGLYAQKETANWFFGYDAGLDFINTQTLGGVNNVPTYKAGPVSTLEGCFTVSDKDGNFMFASDGVTIHNSTFSVMDNGSGLKGHWSAVQSGIVVPVPGSSSLYYVITSSATDQVRNGINYNIVDMNENGGLGKVILKNQALDLGGFANTDMYENISVVGHKNNTDYWLVHRGTRYFFVWKITASGFSVPQTFDTGLNQGQHYASNNYNAGMGSIKFSPDGTKVIHCDARSQVYPYLTFADFDAQTGSISNIKSIRSNIVGLYGVEFSPNGECVYIATHPGASSQRGLYITHVDNLVEPSITLTRALASITNVQLAVDGRIYAIATGSRSLWTILDPDDGGTQISTFTNFFPSTGTVGQGLPSFITSFFTFGNIETDPRLPACIDKEISFSVQIASLGTGENKIAKLEWNFGDGSPIVEEPDMSKYIFVQKHTYSKPGKYNLTLTPYKSDGAVLTNKIKTLEVKISRCIMPVNHNVSVMGYN